ncbi:MAG: hypothetical protein RMK49_11685 [Abditibacteriales bacterium]|nr:hypothetical protein [Abditibacteriales bacterium]
MSRRRRRTTSPLFWDYDLTGDDVRRILAHGTPVKSRWLMERILTQAHWEEIWRCLTPQQVRDCLPELKLPPNLKATWARAGTVVGR